MCNYSQSMVRKILKSYDNLATSYENRWVVLKLHGPIKYNFVKTETLSYMAKNPKPSDSFTYLFISDA